jgi:hypothetical protein
MPSGRVEAKTARWIGTSNAITAFETAGDFNDLDDAIMSYEANMFDDERWSEIGVDTCDPNRRSLDLMDAAAEAFEATVAEMRAAEAKRNSGRCPLRSKLYGGIRSGGGYGPTTEFEIGAQVIAEAAHCILGSLGRHLGHGDDWAGMKRVERGHLHEELGIIKDAITEYSRTLYAERLEHPTRYVRREHHADAIEHADTTVAHIREVSPKLERRARELGLRVADDASIPRDVRHVAVAAYAVLVQLAKAMVAAVQDYPEYVSNPYRSDRLRRAVWHLGEYLEEMYT